MSELETRLRAAIKAQKWSFWVWVDHKFNVDDARFAGAAVGYMEGIKDGQEEMRKLIKEVDNITDLAKRRP